jgi:hypothetical protein
LRFIEQLAVTGDGVLGAHRRRGLDVDQHDVDQHHDRSHDDNNHHRDDEQHVDDQQLDIVLDEYVDVDDDHDQCASRRSVRLHA